MIKSSERQITEQKHTSSVGEKRTRKDYESAGGASEVKKEEKIERRREKKKNFK